MGSSRLVVDLAQFGDRIFLAFRTAPTHFASAKTRTIVVSSLDRKEWDLEADVNMKDGDMKGFNSLLIKNNNQMNQNVLAWALNCVLE